MGRGEKKKEFYFSHVDFEMPVAIPVEMLTWQVDNQVCISGERSQMEIPACRWPLKHYFSSRFWNAIEPMD